MQGKYSPTVSGWYTRDQQWWWKNTQEIEGQYTQFDKDGYDSYGYDANGVDRAGIHENNYACDDETFQDICSEWYLKPAPWISLLRVEAKQYED